MRLGTKANKIIGDFWFRSGVSRVPFQRPTVAHYAMPTLEKHAGDFIHTVQASNRFDKAGKKIYLFGAQYYWTEFCSVLGVALAAMGHRTKVGFIPYPKVLECPSKKDIFGFNLYTRQVLHQLHPWLDSVSLIDLDGEELLPKELETIVDVVSTYDTQYLLQVEEVDSSSLTFKTRWERNNLAVRASYKWLKNDPPDLLVVPNSSVLEYGAVYRVARFLEIPVVTFEFNENREEIWVAQNDDIMRQNTDQLWEAFRDIPLTPTQRTRIEEMEAARKSAQTFGKSDRYWQDVPMSGGDHARQALMLDNRPVVMLATNVLGDSLVLGRDLFSTSMGDWILRTIQFFKDHPESQLVIRVHPGERFMTGPSMVSVVEKAFPQLPENVRLVGPLDKVNTYDLMELICLGLVYTTTTGLEMAMNRIPVVVAGDTHYRARGFTMNPTSWDEYFNLILKITAEGEPLRLNERQVELAWQYAYHFFFTYPLPFPWHLGSISKDIENWPMERVLGSEGWKEYGQTFQYLAGETIDWKAVNELHF